MARAKRRKGAARKARRTAERPRAERRTPAHLGRAARAAPEVLLHPQAPGEPVWKYLWPVLALAFAVRAVVALSGDFAMHPDEIMQYLEQAHRLVFGNGIVHWEQFYGARSWLVPGLVAGVLALLDAVGLDQPVWYVGGVKLVFCALSLAVPAGMYFFARGHFGEGTARAALLAGAFWYELIGFAHKPMTEFVATGLLMGLLTLCVRPGPARPGIIWPAALLAVLAAAVRMQYAPLALALLVLLFLRVGGASGEGGAWWRGARAQLAFAAVLFFLAVGVFDAATWDAELFHSYLANLRFNLALEEARAGSSPPWQYLWWSLLTAAGLSALCLAPSLRDPRRYGLLLGLIVLALIVHSAEAHKEYRFVFVVIPLWLLIGADLVAWLAARRRAWVLGAAGAAFAAVSLAGLLNALPRQDDAYRLIFAPEETPVRFVRDRDPLFAAYRYLAEAPGVLAVWHIDRHYHALPGYYYLHRKIPLYDATTGASLVGTDIPTVLASISHILTADPGLSAPGYAEERTFGALRLLRRLENDAPVRRWQAFTPTVTEASADRIMPRLYPDAPSPPADFGIRFVAPE